MHRSLRFLPALALAALVPVLRADEARPQVEDRDFQKLVFYSVLEGLYDEGATNEEVDLVLKQDGKGYVHFVYGCPLCFPALDAFLVYRGRADFYARKGNVNTFGGGLPEVDVTALKSDDHATRLAALERMVGRWVGRRLSLMRLSAEERAEWEQGLAARREKGMWFLKSRVERGEAPAGMKRCAVCDGSNNPFKR